MSETETGGKWTPGPWEYCESLGLRGGDYFTVIINPENDDWDMIDLREDENGQANARLIAASPAMAEALEKAIPVLLSAHENDASVVSWAALESARAALKLAKGE